MISVNEIKDRLNIILFKKFNEFTYYTERLPKDFERPSFFIDFITVTYNAVNVSTLLEEYHFQLIYFSTVDEYNISNNNNLHEVLKNTMYLFRKGYIECKSRAIKVDAKVGEVYENEFAIDLKFTLNQQRLKEEDESQYEMIEKINIKRRI